MKIFLILITALITNLFGSNIPNIQIISADNTSGKISPTSIQKALVKAGFRVDSNNNMNKAFLANHGKTHYPIYNLLMFRDNELSRMLLDKKNNFGFLIPLTMSIWQENNTINVATLSLEGLSRASQIDINDKELIQYSEKITRTLKEALPQHKMTLVTSNIENLKNSYATEYTIPLNNQDNKDIEDIKEELQEEFEGELESYGFKFPNFIDINSAFYGEKSRYDFYDTFSICKIEVIFHVSKRYPSAGSYAPCSFYMYKLKSENVVKVGFLSVENWIKSLKIDHQASLKPLLESQAKIETLIKELE